MKLANLAGLLAGATDLPASDLGWVKCSTLSSYDGPGVPGNFDTHLNQIVAKHSLAGFQGRKGLQHQGERMEWPPAGGKQEQHEAPLAPLVDYLPEEWKAA